MRSALYYPFTAVESASLVKTSLLLWDRLEYIVPWQDFRPAYDDPAIARAIELIGFARVPTEGEKREAHAHVEDLVRRSIPPNFYFDSQWNRPEYEMYPQKLLHETWELLRASRLAGKMRASHDYPVSEPIGLRIMSIVADCCAGSTRSRVTDRAAAYATLIDILGKDAETPRRNEHLEKMVQISLNVIDAPNIDMRKLIRFRERESKEAAGQSLRDLRHRYVDSLESYLKRLTSEKVTASDSQEILRQFEDDMKSDLADLRTELGYTRREALLSKELLISAIAGIGTAASWLFGIGPVPILGALTAAGAPATLIGGLGTANRYFSARRATMKRHPMAYLYDAK